MSVQDIDLPENCLNEQDIKLFVPFEFKGIGQETEISPTTSSKLFSRSRTLKYRVVPSAVSRALKGSSWSAECVLQIVMLNSLSDLHGYVDKGQLTRELGGSLEYCHSQWIHHRTVSQHTSHQRNIQNVAGVFMLLQSHTWVFSSSGHRELCNDSENHSPDVAEVRDRPGWDGAAQRRPVHQRPAHSTHRQTRQPQGDQAESEHEKKVILLIVWKLFCC